MQKYSLSLSRNRPLTPKKRKSGFTLLEILLVVGIISILAGIVIVAINPSRQLATVRNAQRKSDIKQINSAMMQFYIDNAYYPASTTPITTLTEVCDTGATSSPSGVTCIGMVDLSELVPIYITSIPVDPQGPVLGFLNKITTPVFAATGGTGYSIMKDTTNKLILNADRAELDQVIAIGTTTASTSSPEPEPETVPDAPTIGTATAGNTTATVTYTAPVDNGGSTILDYTVTSNPGSISTTTTSATTATVTGLTNSTAYAFTVTARNAIGNSSASGESNSVTPVAIYTSVYPPGYSTTYVKATTAYYAAHFATDPSKSLTGAYWSSNNWCSSYTVVTNQAFHIDLGSSKTIGRIYYENSHNSGNNTNTGAKNFTLWGSNDASAFADTTYANDTNWTQITGLSASQFVQHVALNQVDPQYITISTPVTYRYFRFKIADRWGGDYLGLRRIVLQTSN